MVTVNALSEVAALMGDPARASMLQLLMDGRAHTASDLALTAGVTAQTASGHLARMVEANLLAARASRARWARRSPTHSSRRAGPSAWAAAARYASPIQDAAPLPATSAPRSSRARP